MITLTPSVSPWTISRVPYSFILHVDVDIRLPVAFDRESRLADWAYAVA